MNTAIHKSKPRKTVMVSLPDGTVLEGNKGTTIEEFLRYHYDDPFKYVAAISNGVLRELTYAPECDETIEPIDLSSSEGIRIYRRSLAFLMVTAIEELFPGVEVFIDHAVPFGGYFCDIRGREKFNRDELSQIYKHMKKIVEEDNPINRIPVPLEEAREIFRSRNEFDKLRLVDRRSKNVLMMYQLRERIDGFYGYMVPSAGYVQRFALWQHEDGFLLQFIRRTHPAKMNKPYDSPKLTEVFREYGNWLKILKIDNIGQINELINKDRIREVIMASEALQEQKVAQIASWIANHKDAVKLVLIAGPSSSGKTTFAKRLAIQLIANGLQPFTLELDRYFVDRDATPRDENGEPDFEVIEALDIELFNSNLNDLMAGKEIILPKFNFVSGKRETGTRFHLKQNQVIIAEGIHGLNPKLVADIPKKAIDRIYISALTQLNIDRHNRIATTDTRLIRRLVRDAAHRGWTAEDTLNMWEKVRRGEKRNIFPFQENADIMFNSALVYELAALKPLVVPLLLQVKPQTRAYITAKRLLAFLNLCESIPKEYVPNFSILREFVGGSMLHDYLPGKHFDEV
jgi:uridine kinase